VLNKILVLLNPVDQQIVRSLADRIGMWSDSVPSLAPVADLRRAVAACCEVEVQYYSAPVTARSVTTSGRWRCSPTRRRISRGLRRRSDCQEKLFRLDRMADVKPLSSTFQPPADLDLERFRRARIYAGDGGSGAEVRFSADVAEQYASVFADAPHELEKGGTVKVRLSTSSPAWLARWVLPFGKSAEVLAPEEQRQYLARLCSRRPKRTAASARRQAPVWSAALSVLRPTERLRPRAGRASSPGRRRVARAMSSRSGRTTGQR